MTFYKPNIDDVKALKIEALLVPQVRELVPFMERFYAEAEGPTVLTLAPDKAVRSIQTNLLDGTARAAVARSGDNEIVGFFILGYDDMHTVEKTAFVYAIYVLPEWRRSALPRVLVWAAEHMAAADGAVMIHAVCPDHLKGGGRSFLNLLRKARWSPVAGAAYKRLDHGLRT